MKQFKYQCKHITDYDTQPLPVIARRPHQRIMIDLPMEDTQPRWILSQFETIHAHSIILPKEQEEVDREEYFTKVSLLFILTMIFAVVCFIGWVLLFGGFPA